MRFLNSDEVHRSERVALLGDVFDHLTGEHEGYLQKFQPFFERIVEILKAGKHVYFIEGNHDFHFRATFSRYLKKNLDKESFERFYYGQNGFELKLGERKVLFCHGDLLDWENKAYMRWKRIYSSKIFGFFISKFMSFKLVESIGEKASQDSRERGKQSFDHTKEKEKYRLAAQEYMELKGIDALVAGHTHIQDDFFWENRSYHNIGFPLRDKSFVVYSENGLERFPL